MTLVCKQSVVNVYRYSFFVNFIFIWNRLPFSVVSVSSRSVFHSSVYKLLCVDSQLTNLFILLCILYCHCNCICLCCIIAT